MSKCAIDSKLNYYTRRQNVWSGWPVYEACEVNLVMISSLASKCQDFKVWIPVFQPFYVMKLKTSMFELYEHQNRTILGSDQVSSGKNTEINKQSHVKFWFNRKKYGAVSYSLSCR